MDLLSYTDYLLTEASQETIKNLLNKKIYYTERIQKINEFNLNASEKIKRFKEREAITKNELTKKIYQERISEEGMKQKNYATRLKAIQERIKIIEKQINIAKLRMQSQAQKKAKL